MADTECKGVIAIDCYSDVLCVWAYVAQARIDELRANLGNQVRLNHYYLNLFGCTAHRIGEGWKDRGGYPAFSDHVLEVCSRFNHLEINPAVWRDCRPAGSGNAHLMLKAIQLLEQNAVVDPGTADALAWRIRLAFFRDALDIGDWHVLMELAEAMSIERPQIESVVVDGSALASLARDQELRDQHQIAGSPTYVLDHGRQKLFGNVGYRVIEANVMELLTHPESQGSWC